MARFTADGPNRLNLGCGHHQPDGWINIDSFPLPGIDLRFDLELREAARLPFPDCSVDEFLLQTLPRVAIERLGD